MFLKKGQTCAKTEQNHLYIERDDYTGLIDLIYMDIEKWEELRNLCNEVLNGKTKKV